MLSINHKTMTKLADPKLAADKKLKYKVDGQMCI